MPLSYPASITTDDERLACCERTLEILRLLHNAVGDSVREGTPLAAIPNMPTWLRTHLPAAGQVVTPEVWQRFRAAWRERHSLVVAERQRLRDFLDPAMTGDVMQDRAVIRQLRAATRTLALSVESLAVENL